MPGGGGQNSAVSIARRVPLMSNYNITYVDVSAPDDVVTDNLRLIGIEFHFLGYRPIPVNAIIGGREDMNNSETNWHFCRI